jgi:phage FluMu protein Com
MPIRFQCDRCEGVLSIARRKAYALIDCPKCGCKQVVPAESRLPHPSGKADNLDELESDDIQAETSTAVAVVIAPKVIETTKFKDRAKESTTQEQPFRDRPLFERADIENLLSNETKKSGIVPTITPSNRPVDQVTQATKSTSTTAEFAAGVELIATADDVLLRKNQMMTVIILGVLLFLFAFGLGFVAGKFS